MLTITFALDTWRLIVPVELTLPYVAQLNPIHNSKFSLNPFAKSEFLSIIINRPPGITYGKLMMRFTYLKTLRKLKRC
jgi:hypothetical protein